MGGEGSYSVDIVGTDGEDLAYTSASLVLECEPPPPPCGGNYVLQFDGSGNPVCPECQTMFFEVKAWAAPGGETCIGGTVDIVLAYPTVELCGNQDDWWTASTMAFSLTIGVDEASATPVALEFYPNGCVLEGCNVNGRSWYGPDPFCSGQSTSCHYTATGPDGDITAFCFQVSDQGGC